MKTLYLKLIAVLINDPEIKQRYIDVGLMPVQHIDLYAGQDVNPQYFELAIYPALFVAFSVDHAQTPNVLNLTVRICYEQLRDTSNVSENTREAVMFLDFIRLTGDILESIETEETGRLRPVATDQQIEETVTDEFILTYETSYKKKPDPSQERTGVVDDIKLRGELLKKRLS